MARHSRTYHFNVSQKKNMTNDYIYMEMKANNIMPKCNRIMQIKH
jgi:hypothetical protein